MIHLPHHNNHHLIISLYTFLSRAAYQSNDFDLVFDRKVQGYADTEFYQDLRAFTVSFWLKVMKDLDTGTIMSYAFGDDECKSFLKSSSISNIIVSYNLK